MRRPNIGEMRVCGCCGGDCQPFTEEQVKVWTENDDIGTYDASLDRFLGYDDGCEEPMTKR